MKDELLQVSWVKVSPKKEVWHGHSYWPQEPMWMAFLDNHPDDLAEALRQPRDSELLASHTKGLTRPPIIVSGEPILKYTPR